MRQPIKPVMATELILEMRRELLHILESLTDAEWHYPTVCEGWSVRDIALHILGDDMGLLSNMRDADGQYHAFQSWDELVAFINAQNDLWVKATRRLSRKVLLGLLHDMGEQVYTLFTTIDPFKMGGPIGWAGTQPDPMWLHIAREYTEYWAHHQHICDAIGRISLKEPRFVLPLLATYVHALPHTLRNVIVPEHTLVKFVVTGSGGHIWHLVREGERWVLYDETDLIAITTMTLNSETAW